MSVKPFPPTICFQLTDWLPCSDKFQTRYISKKNTHNMDPWQMNIIKIYLGISRIISEQLELLKANTGIPLRTLSGSVYQSLLYWKELNCWPKPKSPEDIWVNRIQNLSIIASLYADFDSFFRKQVKSWRKS